MTTMKNKNNSINDHTDRHDIDEEDCIGGGGDDDGSNHSGSKSIPDDTSYFYIVDMDLTSQGEMCDEISHLSDPTTGGGGGGGDLTGGGGRKNGRRIGGIGSRRRINFRPLRQPIAALRDRLLLNHNNSSSTSNTFSNQNKQHHGIRQQHPARPQKDQQGEQRVALSLKHPYHNVNQKEDVIGHKGDEKGHNIYRHDQVSPVTSRKITDGQTSPSLYYQSLEKENYGSTASNIVSTGKMNSNEHNLLEGGRGFMNIQNIETNTTTGGGRGPTTKELPPYRFSTYQQLQHQHHAMGWDDNDEKLLLFDDDRTETPKSMSVDMFGGNSIGSSNRDFFASSSKVGGQLHGQQQNHVTSVSTTDPTSAVRPSMVHQGTAFEKCVAKFLSNISFLNDSKNDSINPSFGGSTSNKTYWYSGIFSRPSNGHHRSSYCSSFDSKKMMSFAQATFEWILHHWTSFVLVISIILFVVGCFDQVFLSAKISIHSDTSPSSIQRIIDILYWCVVSFTTIGGGLNGTSNDENIGGVVVSTPTMLICTTIYALLGVTSLAVGWGHHNGLLVYRAEQNQKRKQDLRVDQVFNAFCNDAEKEISSSTSGNVFSNESERSFSSTEKDALLMNQWTKDVKGTTKALTISHGKILLVPFVVCVFAIVLGTISGWNLLQSIYFTTITAFSMADNTIYPTTAFSKILTICMIPFCLVLTIRWMLTVSNFINHPSLATHLNTDGAPITKEEVSQLLQSAKMDDGLLTRADFMELMLLAMKKVDPDLLIELREGFERATIYGSIDMTRREWIAKATNALDKPIRSCKKKNESMQPSTRLIRNSQVASRGVSAWLLGLDGPMLENTQSAKSGAQTRRLSIAIAEV